MLAGSGAEIMLVVPSAWPGDDPTLVAHDAVEVIEAGVKRPGDVNRHAYVHPERLRALVREFRPDVLDVHEEPFSVAAHQLCSLAPTELPVVMYTAQNVDKRFPPPFCLYERRSHGRVAAMYPCSRQAASVARGKGFGGSVEVIPLGHDPEVFRPGEQSLADEELVLGLFGRLVPEKGVRDAVRVLERVNRTRPARLVLAGDGPGGVAAEQLAAELGVGERLVITPWQSTEALAELYRTIHVALVPSRATATWVEQFGRVIVEAQACGAVVAGYASGAIPEVAGAAGVLVPEGQVDALAAAVTELITSEKAWVSRRRAGYELASSRTWSAVAGRQLELYARVVDGKRPPRRALPADPHARRELARREFGPPAVTPAGERPFALPLLRRGGAVARSLARVIDAALARR